MEMGEGKRGKEMRKRKGEKEREEKRGLREEK